MLESIFLGIVQGLTEFIPVSSTAHLILLPAFFNWKGDLTTLSYDVALHGGTLFSLLLYFRRQWLRILTEDRHLLLMIIVGTIPAGIAGFALEDVVSGSLRSPLLIAAALVVFGGYMLAAERIGGERELSNISVRDSLFIGISQAVALIPGVSRSGITISTGLFRGIKRKTSAEFSFLLSMPVIAGATILEGFQIAKDPHLYDLSLFAAGFISSAITGFLIIKFLLWFFERFSLRVFVYYRFILAGIILISLWLRG
jgi:undecaprenyl-diphosphatase